MFESDLVGALSNVKAPRALKQRVLNDINHRLNEDFNNISQQRAKLLMRGAYNPDFYKYRRDLLWVEHYDASSNTRYPKFVLMPSSAE